MKKSVEITTPIPSADAVAARLGVSKTRRQALYAIVDGRFRDMNSTIRSKRSDTTLGTLRKDHGNSKKSKAVA